MRMSVPLLSARHSVCVSCDHVPRMITHFALAFAVDGKYHRHRDDELRRRTVNFRSLHVPPRRKSSLQLLPIAA